MTRSRIVLGAMLCAALIGGGLAVAQKPEENVQAFEKISEAQRANEWDMNGHAAKAKELLEQVNRELKESAEAANKNHY